MWARTYLIMFGGTNSASGGSGSALAMTYTPVTTATQGTPYTGATPSTTGGTAPYTYSILSGTLPIGLSLNTSTGVISGTPSNVETDTGIVLRVTDNVGTTKDSASFTITISAAVGGPVHSLRFSKSKNSMYLPVPL